MSSASGRYGQVDRATYRLRRRLETIERTSLYWIGLSFLATYLPIGPFLFLGLGVLSIAMSLAGIIAVIWLYLLDRNPAGRGGR